VRKGIQLAEDCVVRGKSGQIKWSYYTAAIVSPYSVRFNRTTRNGSLRAVLVNSDKFKMAQKPLEFVAPFKKRTIRYAIASYELEPPAMIHAVLVPVKEFYR